MSFNNTLYFFLSVFLFLVIKIFNRTICKNKINIKFRIYIINYIFFHTLSLLSKKNLLESYYTSSKIQIMNFSFSQELHKIFHHSFDTVQKIDSSGWIFLVLRLLHRHLLHSHQSNSIGYVKLSDLQTKCQKKSLR